MLKQTVLTDEHGNVCTDGHCAITNILSNIQGNIMLNGHDEYYTVLQTVCPTYITQTVKHTGKHTVGWTRRVLYSAADSLSHIHHTNCQTYRETYCWMDTTSIIQCCR